MDWLRRLAWWLLNWCNRREGRCCPVDDPACVSEGGCEPLRGEE